MKTLITTLAVGTALAASAATVPSDEVLPDAKLEMFHPLADSLSELKGRAVLVEFFAHW